jgi:transposase, IS5 family
VLAFLVGVCDDGLRESFLYKGSGWRPSMFRTVGPSGSLFELFLPAGVRVLSGELAEIDTLLDDPRFFRPFRSFFDPSEGRPSIPIETYLRLLFLKVRFQLGYEQLCVQVTDSLSWRRFCRIGLEASVPDESTVRKLTRRLGPDVVDELNNLLLGLAAEGGHLSLDKVRVDTTVVEADIKYPTDSGLLTNAVSRIAVLMRRVDAAGMAVVYTDRTLQARHHQHEIGVWLRRRSGEAKTEVLVITGLLADLAEASLAEYDAIGKSKRRPKRAARRRLDELVVLAERTRQLIVQARTRIDGGVPPGATRLVSLHEPDARPIAKGRLGKPVEFGYKAQVCDNGDGLIVDHSVHIGNPHDTALLLPAVERIIKQCGGAPVLLTADRGYNEAGMETGLTDAGVAAVVIPKTGKPSAARIAVERSEEFVAAVKWRTGAEGRISHLKRDLGWRRTRLRSHDGARIWCGHGVFTHNLTKLNKLRQ